MPLLARLLFIAGLAAFGLPVAWLFFQFPAMAMLVLAVAAWCNRRGWQGSGYAYGTARLAGLVDLLRAGLVGDSGLILGRASRSAPPSRKLAIRCLLSPAIGSATALRLFRAAWRRRDRSLIRVKDFVHLLTCAPAGAGKSVAVLIPNLLSYIGSCVVIDPKGELWRATAEHRRRVLGHKVFKFDPFGITGPVSESARMNPLDFIDPRDDSFIDDVRAVADSMVVRQGTEPDPHWNDYAVVVIAAMMSFVCGCEADAAKRHLGLVRDIVSSRVVFKDTIKAMQQVTGFGGVVAKFGNLLTWLVDRELGSVMASVQRHTSWMDSPAVAANLATNNFDPRWLRSGKVTLFLILPHDKISTLAPLMRLWLSTILRVLTKSGPSEKQPVLFLIDEAAHLGKMQILQDAMTLMRGFGIRIWLFFQSIDQMKSCYGENANVILDNAATQQYFGLTSLATAEEISRRIGDATILVETINGGSSTSRPTGWGGGQSSGNGSYSVNDGYSVSEIGRRLIRPEELLLLEFAIVFHKAVPPIAAELVRYYDAPEFRGRRAGRKRGRGLAVAALLMLLAGGLLAAAALDWPPAGPITSDMPKGRGRPPYELDEAEWDLSVDPPQRWIIGPPSSFR